MMSVRAVGGSFSQFFGSQYSLTSLWLQSQNVRVARFSESLSCLSPHNKTSSIDRRIRSVSSRTVAT